MKTQKIKLPFALDEKNVLLHIEEVDSNKKSNYFCPSCKCLLVAAKGESNQHHFKHKSTKECEGSSESAIHFAAKKELLKRKKITLPAYIVNESALDSKNVKYSEAHQIISTAGKEIFFDCIEEEKEINDIRADILAEVDGRQLIIEIFYRHKVDNSKQSKITGANISGIEIDLSNLTPNDVIDRKSFWSCLNDPSRIKWLHNSKDISVRSKLKEKLKYKINNQEKEYVNEENRRQKKHQTERNGLNHAIEELQIERSEESISEIKKRATQHSAWKLYSNFPIDELPDHLNFDVSDCDWIFGCDRRVWQTAIYNHFICQKAKKFSVKLANDWLNNKAKCITPSCVKIIGIYRRKHNDLVSGVPGTLPSSWKNTS